MKKKILGVMVCCLLVLGCWKPSNSTKKPKSSPPPPLVKKEANPLIFPGEKHFRNAKQLTTMGQNGEAYFSFDGKQLIFQSTRGKYPCDQIYTMDLQGQNKKLISHNRGRSTCGYFLENGNILYSSTHLQSPKCPPPPPRSLGYVWALYKSYDIFIADPSGKILKRLTKNPRYDAEATLSPDGKQIVFTSLRNGDIDLYVMDTGGGNLRRLTHQKGYDGGAFFSPDGKQIVYRAYHPKTEKEIAEYDSLLKKNLVRPHGLNLFVMDSNGKNRRQITHNDKANFAPFFHPSGKKIIFCANLEGRHTYELYMIGLDGKNLERITYSKGFTSFPMFSPDGKKLVFISNRTSKNKRTYQVFVCDWVE